MSKKAFTLLLAAMTATVFISLVISYFIASAIASPIEPRLPQPLKVEMLTAAILEGVSVEGEQVLDQTITCRSADEINYFCQITAVSGNEYRALVTLETIDDVTFALPAELELTKEIEIEVQL